MYLTYSLLGIRLAVSQIKSSSSRKYTAIVYWQHFTRIHTQVTYKLDRFTSRLQRILGYYIQGCILGLMFLGFYSGIWEILFSIVFVECLQN